MKYTPAHFLVTLISLSFICHVSNEAQWIQAKSGLIPTGAYQAARFQKKARYFARHKQFYTDSHGVQKFKYYPGYITQGQDKATIYMYMQGVTYQDTYQVLVSSVNDLKWVSTDCSVYIQNSDYIGISDGSHDNQYLGRGHVMHYNTDIMSPGHFETIQGGLKIIKSQGIQIINSFDILTKRIGSHKQMQNKVSDIEKKIDDKQTEKIVWIVISSLLMACMLALTITVIVLSCRLCRNNKRLVHLKQQAKEAQKKQTPN